MGVYIKGMEMPFTCLSCDFHKCAAGVGDYCTLTKKKQFRFKNRPSYCPLVPVPPHGDLIDRDALLKDGADYEYPLFDIDGSWDCCTQCFDVDSIKNAPTIIPAEEET